MHLIIATFKRVGVQSFAKKLKFVYFFLPLHIPCSLTYCLLSSSPRNNVLVHIKRIPRYPTCCTAPFRSPFFERMTVQSFSPLSQPFLPLCFFLFSGPLLASCAKEASAFTVNFLLPTNITPSHLAPPLFSLGSFSAHKESKLVALDVPLYLESAYSFSLLPCHIAPSSRFFKSLSFRLLPPVSALT